MTTKHFKVIAQTLRASNLWWVNSKYAMQVVYEFVTTLEELYPRFDRSKFINACVPAGLEMTLNNVLLEVINNG